MTLARGNSSGGFIQQTGTTAHGYGGGGFVNDTLAASTLNTRTVATQRTARVAVSSGPLVARSISSNRRVRLSSELAGPIRAEALAPRAGRTRSTSTRTPIVARSISAQAGRTRASETAGPLKTQSVSTRRRAAASSASSTTRDASAHVLAGKLTAASTVVEEMIRGVVGRPRAVAGSETSQVSRTTSVSTAVRARATLTRGSTITVSRSVSARARVSGQADTQAQRITNVSARGGQSHEASTSVHSHQTSITSRSPARSTVSSRATRQSNLLGRSAYARVDTEVSTGRYTSVSAFVRSEAQLSASRVVSTSVMAQGFMYARLISGRYAMGRLCLSDIAPLVVSAADAPLGYVEAKDEVLQC